MKFCGQCASRLGRRCPQCGFENPAGFAFCGQCATPLTAASSTTAPSPQTYTPAHLVEKILTSKAALEGERTQMAVLFADLKGSLELLADRGPEEARQILAPVLVTAATLQLAEGGRQGRRCGLLTDGAAPAAQTPPAPPPLRTSTRRRQRHVDTSHQFCPDPTCRYQGSVGRGHIRANGHPGGGPWRQFQCAVC